LVDSLAPVIGTAGLYIFVLIGFIISGIVLYENSDFDVSNMKTNLKNKIKLKNSIDIKKLENNPTNKRREKRSDPVDKETETTDSIMQSINEKLDTSIKTEQASLLDDTNEYNIEPVKENIKTETINEIKEEVVEIIEEKIEEKIPDSHSVIVDELEENRKLLEDIELGKTEKPKDFELPPSSFFQPAPKEKKSKVSENFIDQKIADLLDKLSMFKIEGDVVRTYTGPVVTTFEFKPAPNVKVSKILNLQDDLAMALKAQTIRIQAPIPGKDVVGIEVPNDDTQTIYLREMLDSELFQNSKSPLTMILGKDIVGKPFVTDLKKLPHLLIAGTTGSGKSVGINSMILSLLYKNSPDNLRLVMIDPKMLEFSMYNDIPHLLTPVITKAGDAINALSNMVSEMERRYTLMSQTKTKNIENYNEKAKREGYDKFPYIVVVIDELADLMMTSGKDVEYSIARLAQMARASGIHLIVATQRPSVDVVTGLIKANLPSRLSYKVGQKVDSKIILDSMGAESLLGRGDMLFTPPGMSGLVRIHAPWSTEEEIEKVVDFLKAQRDVEYDMNFIKDSNSSSSSSTSSDAELGDLDELYNDAREVVLTDKKTSISYIQRKLRIGYNRAATIVEQLEQTGVLSEANAKGNREILI
jgi:S-DNA-T family DNA segregation ATPase FtsK/SpoIIIE